MRESYEINRRDGRHRLEGGGSTDCRGAGGQPVNKCYFGEGIPLVASGHPRHRLEDGRLRTVFRTMFFRSLILIRKGLCSLARLANRVKRAVGSINSHARIQGRLGGSPALFKSTTDKAA